MDVTPTLESIGGWPALITSLLDRQDLPAGHARAAMSTILEGEAVGGGGKLEEPITQGPARLVQLGGHARGVAEGVGRVIPCLVGHQRPVHELRPRVVGVRVVVEDVLHVDASHGDRHPRHVALAAEVQGVVGDRFHGPEIGRAHV